MAVGAARGNDDADLVGPLVLGAGGTRWIDADHDALAIARLDPGHVPEALVKITETSFQDGRNYSVSSAKAIGDFGFSPKWSVDDGIVEVASLVREGRIKDISIARYSNHDTLKPLLSSETTPLGTIHAVRGRVGVL